MTPELIQTAIDNALAGKSKLSEEALQVPGFTSSTIRHLMNNLGGLAKNYLEIGVYRAATFVSTIYGNSYLIPVGIDSFVEFNEEGSKQQECEETIKKYMNGFCPLIVADCFEVEAIGLNKTWAQGKGFDLYLYDGGHSVEQQEKGITHFWDALADTAIIVIDDAIWPQVHNGTLSGLSKVKKSFSINWRLTGPEWWNGIEIWLIKK